MKEADLAFFMIDLYSMISVRKGNWTPKKAAVSHNDN